MSKNKKLIIAFSIMICAIVALAIVIILPPQKTEEELPKAPQKVSVTIKAVGDNLMHSPIFNSCRTDDGYNFDGLYTHITPYIEDADIAAINQETIFVDSASAFSGYPAFGTPSQVGESIEKAGFNLITHATNHTYDRGYDAVMHTAEFWKQYDHITVLGINETEADGQEVEIWEKDGLKIAMLNFTYGLNGYRLPQDKKYLVNILDHSERNQALLKNAEERADITVVFLHFGTEYTHTPTAEQKRDVEFLCQNGADVIIGGHPHVIQPVTEHTSENGNKAVVFYSLGNFVSNQSGAEKVLGGMANVTIAKENGKTIVEHYEMLPTVTHAEGGIYTAYMLSDYTDELARKHRRCYGLTTEKLWNLYDRVMAIEVN